MPKTPAKVHNAVPELARFLVPIAEVMQHPENARRGDVDVVAASLVEHGQYRPAVVQASTGYVCVGNHMLQAAERLGWTHIAAIKRDLTDEQARRLRVVDNRSHDLGDYDQEKLLAELEGIRQDAAAAAADLPTDEAMEAASGALFAVGFDQLAFDGLIAAVRGRPTGDPKTPPGEFADPEAGMTTDFCCPQCGYEWSGQAKPTAEAA